MAPVKPEAPLTEVEARDLAAEFRARFRDRDTFDAAWHSLFELKTAITPSLARRFLHEEFIKYRARMAGLTDTPTDLTSVPPSPRDARTYRCPGCDRHLGEWTREGHAETCPHFGCYELEVRATIAIASRKAAAALRKEPHADASPHA